MRDVLEEHLKEGQLFFQKKNSLTGSPLGSEPPQQHPPLMGPAPPGGRTNHYGKDCRSQGQENCLLLAPLSTGTAEHIQPWPHGFPPPSPFSIAFHVSNTRNH